MTDDDIRREIEANNQRAERDEDRDDGPIIDTAEDIINPLVRGVGTNYDDEQEGVEQRRAENDAEQRREQ
jgi:hypothetical protein